MSATGRSQKRCQSRPVFGYTQGLPHLPAHLLARRPVQRIACSERRRSVLEVGPTASRQGLYGAPLRVCPYADHVLPGGRRMARTSVHRLKAILLCFVLGCLVLPVCTALGSTSTCVKSGNVTDDPRNFHFASRSDACVIIAGGFLVYDSNAARCVQGSGGCDFRN